MNPDANLGALCICRCGCVGHATNAPGPGEAYHKCADCGGIRRDGARTCPDSAHDFLPDDGGMSCCAKCGVRIAPPPRSTRVMIMEAWDGAVTEINRILHSHGWRIEFAADPSTGIATAAYPVKQRTPPDLPS